jgi:tetratricopeptide (TPR) repeat protein
VNTNNPPPATELVKRSERLDGYLQHDPSNEQLLGDAFDAALAAGRIDAAEAHVRAGLVASGNAPSWAFRQATCAIARNDLSSALSLLAALPSSVRAEAAVQFNVGLVHYRLKQYRECVDALAPLVVDQADGPDWAHRAQAMWLRAMHRLGDLEPAWIWLLQVQQAGRALDPEVCGVASLLAFDLNHVEQAQLLAMRALQTLPRQAEALVTHGSIALGRGDAALATSCAQDVLRDTGNDGRTRSLLGFARMLAQDLPGALENFQQAVTLMPGHVGTWHGLGWTHLLLGDIDASIRAFTAALDLDRNFGENHGALAVVLAIQGKTQEAAAEAERALRLDPTGASAQYAKLLLSGQGRDPAAIQRLAQRLLKGLARQRSPSGAGSAADGQPD